MKMLKKLLFIAIFTIGLSLTAMAQNQDQDNKRPPKEKPEIKAEDKNPPKNDNRNNDNRNNERPKKPDSMSSQNGRQINISYV